MDVGGDAAAVVDDPAAAVGQQRDVDAVAVAGHGLVDGVVDDLPDAVVQAGGAGRADVHARALADRIEALEDLHVLGSVGGASLRQGAPFQPRSSTAVRPALGWFTSFRLVRPADHNERSLPAGYDVPDDLGGRFRTPGLVSDRARGPPRRPRRGPAASTRTSIRVMWRSPASSAQARHQLGLEEPHVGGQRRLVAHDHSASPSIPAAGCAPPSPRPPPRPSARTPPRPRRPTACPARRARGRARGRARRCRPGAGERRQPAPSPGGRRCRGLPTVVIDRSSVQARSATASPGDHVRPAATSVRSAGVRHPSARGRPSVDPQDARPARRPAAGHRRWSAASGPRAGWPAGPRCGRGRAR